jgi:predicted MFS family arabinose efflux permease
MSLENSNDHFQTGRRREQLVLFILAAVQFTTIVDFMIVMPLGPQLMRTLKISPAEFSVIVSSYTFAAGFAGLVASSIVDRFARRTTFMVLYAGFLLGTFLCAVAPNYLALVAARIVTGAFGGVLGGISMTIVGDVFPEERRGRATGSLMSGFALASVAGVPLGLFLGTNFGWYVPFVVLAVAGIPVLLLTPLALPVLNAHVGQHHAHPLRSAIEMFTTAGHLNAFALMIALMLGSFTVFPYVSTYFVANVGMTEQELPLIYIVGGGLTLFAAPIFGKLADRYGKLRVFRIAIPVSAALLLAVTTLPRVPVAVAVVVFGSLMVSNVGRMIAAMAMITGSVEPRRRGGFMSANSSIQHVASGLGASISGIIVSEAPDGRLEHFGAVGLIAATSTLTTLWLAGRVRILELAPISAQGLSMAAAAEATVDAGEPMVAMVQDDRHSAGEPR